ncbi:DUF3617 family protein [Sphingomicrobium sp. XHP0235]|uniref:DUF3617 domain-containing protein n=1 Tax=Sphingomicrobium aquimarinum TaxID=3133971 RepID=UPI0031FEDA73
MKRALIAMSGAALALMGAGAMAADSASAPRILAPIPGGSWQVSDVGKEGSGRKLCVADVSALAQYEHRGNQCTRVTVSESGKKALIRYTCTKGGFGTSEIEVTTPRSLTIRTQGIKDGLPFNRTLIARRTGAC